MREILFRGKRTDNKQWVEGFYARIGEENPSAYIIINNGHRIRVAHKSISQYTGLTDKNGKKIFEGDIVKGLFSYHMPVNSVVCFRDGAFGLLWHRGDVEMYWAFTSICNVEYEVIGNIHNNPDLVKGEQ